MSAYLNFNQRKGGKNTVTINGVEYYQAQSYGVPSYYHLNERPVGGKKSAAVSNFLDSAIPIATKYATAAAALGLPIAAGNPELVPASLLVQSDVHPILSKKIRKLVKDKTGYGVYNKKFDQNYKPLSEVEIIKMKKGGKKKCRLENRWYLFITKKVSVL